MSDRIVFFVDDDKMIINLMEYTFRSRADYEVKTFYTGEECIENLHLNPELIILDYIFKKQKDAKLSGLDTLKKIKEINDSIPVVMLTSEDDTTLVEEFKKYGAYKYIAKDAYFIDTLIETVEEILQI